MCTSPILFRTFHFLTPTSELPPLPRHIKSYWPIHAYTLTQIIVTTGIFVLTLTIAGPAFPIVIIALVPIRLLLFNKLWDRETLRYVDAWACRDGCPEDDEDKKLGLAVGESRRANNANGDENTNDIELGVTSGTDLPSDLTSTTSIAKI